MHLILLGTAAGGGFPQWNCWCPGCRIARDDPARAVPRTQSSIAVSADGERWILINASPDVRDQLRGLRRPAPDPAVRRNVPIETVVLTDGELDHSVGLLLLREGRMLSVYATRPTLAVLERDSRILPTVRAFATVSLVPLTLDRAVSVQDRAGAETGLTLEAFAVAGNAPRFATSDDVGSTVGVILRDRAGSTAAYVPGCGAIDQALVDRLRSAEIVLFDGTFWSDEELVTLDIAPTRAREMGHVPIGGADGSLAMLSGLPARARVYTHINNTNPVLIEDSNERRIVGAAGIIVGCDGMMLSTGVSGTPPVAPYGR
jgi:pyrroloquinoline quinone biosynthesis protein B